MITLAPDDKIASQMITFRPRWKHFVSRCRALKPAGRPLPHCRGGNGPPSATRRLRGGEAVVDSKNIVYHVNSSACYVYVTSFYSTTSISFYKSFYTLRVLYTFYSYIFAAIFVQAMSLFYVYTHPRLYFTPTLICGCTVVSTVPDVCRRLYSTPTFIWFYASAAHHLPCFQGGKECMATLHSSDRDFTLHYILHLHLANIFVIQASTNILHSTSTFCEHFRI